MATLIVVSMLLFVSANEVFALALLGFMAFMMTMWAVFDFCPVLKVLAKFMKPCNKACGSI